MVFWPANLPAAPQRVQALTPEADGIPKKAKPKTSFFTILVIQIERDRWLNLQ